MAQLDDRGGDREAQEAVPDLARLAGDGAVGEDDPHLLRIRRLGKRLFDMANCIVILEGMPAAGDARSLEALEEGFCRSMAASDSPLVVHDTRAHPVLRRHPAVAGAPGIRFFAAHPVRNQEGGVSGAVALIDYVPRQGFMEADRSMLADLVALVEREVHLRQMSAFQLELQKKNKNLRRKSLIDPLIRTWNRGAIMRILTIEAARCDKAGLPLSLIVADLDHFKQINDRYGHPAGDAVLVDVAGRLRSCMRPQEALGRYGGEEFLVVLPGSSHQAALAVAERMRAAVAAEPAQVVGTTLRLSISAGVASTDMFPMATTDELISRADMALYVAKDEGRNRVVNATPDLS